MSKKVTAVEFLIDEIRNCIKENGRLDAITISALRTMGKGMEKQQHQQTAIYFYPSALKRINFEQYYKETYGN